MSTVSAWRQFGGDRATWAALTQLGEAILADMRTLEELAHERLVRDNQSSFVKEWNTRVEDTWLDASVAASQLKFDQASKAFFEQHMKDESARQ